MHLWNIKVAGVVLTIVWGCFGLGLFCAESAVAASSGESNVTQTELVGGGSLREVNGLYMMSQEYAQSPAGQPVPTSADDLWLPEMSLQNRSASNSDSGSMVAPQPPEVPPAPWASASTVNNAGNIPNTTPISVNPVPTYNPGFAIGAGAVSTGNNAMSSPLPAASAPVLPPAMPITNQPTTNQNVSEPTGWTEQFSKPTDPDKARETEIALSDKDLNGLNLAAMTIEDIRVSGLEMPTYKFNNLIKTKIGQKFDQQRLEEDKRSLLHTKLFIDVTISTTLLSDKPESLIVNFDLIPRRVMQYIKVIGNRKFSKTNLLEEIGMKRGDSRMDPYDVENGRLRIVELYKNKGYTEPNVQILRGDQPEDVGVVYLIDEGLKQRVLKTEFVGNEITSAARLRSLVNVKPGILYYLGGEFSRERLDEDVTKLLEYYRKLGFFDAKIDREYEEGRGYSGWGKENSWITVRYVITEGERYKVRNFSFEGNKIISNEQLADLLKVKKDDFYNQNEIEADRLAVTFEYQNKGYVLAEIEPKQIFTEDDGYLDICYQIVEKSRYRVRDILISYDGDEARTKSTTILNMLDIRPGQVLDGQKIRASENTMRRSGYFNDKPTEGILPTIKIVPDSDKPMAIFDDPLKLSSSSTKSKTKVKRISLRDSQEPEAENTATADSSTIRGQTRQVPTGFSATTTNPQAVVNANTVFPAASAQVAGTANSSYSDTSQYNNYQTPAQTYDPNMQVTTPAQIAPPIEGTSAANPQGLYSQTVPNGNGAYSQMAMAPGFNPAGLAGVDAVFPGTPQQQALSNSLLSPGTLQNQTIGNADVVAQIKEGRTGMFQASVGVNSDYGLVGNISLTERNFDLFRWPTAFGRADGWKDAFRGGGQIFQIQAAPGTQVQRYSVSWDIPYIFDTKNNFGVTGLYGQRYYTQWFETRIGGEVRLGRQWTPRFSSSLNGSYYNVKIGRPAVDYVPDLTDALGKHDMFTLGLTGTYDTRNHPFLPSEGYVITGGGEMVMGAYQFPRLSYDARHYQTLRKRWDGSGRWVVGLRSAAGWSGDNTPIFERYYGGGSMNLRGFEFREVTPRYQDTTFGIGGNFEFYNSAELLVPLSGGDEFQLALFVDTGTVASKIDKWDAYRVAPGFGFRVAIPMLGPAPLALDFAFPVTKGKGDVSQVFSFSLSGSR